jgi:hypothetical protein
MARASTGARDHVGAKEREASLAAAVRKQAGPWQAMLVVAGSEALDGLVKTRLGNRLR